jgi:dTDP-4-dehydrorhamnose reductase
MKTTAKGRPVMVLGALGQLGHAMVRACAARGHDIVAVGRTSPATDAEHAALAGAAFVTQDLLSPGAVTSLLEAHNPRAVVNAAGAVKQLGASVSNAEMVHLNALLPHQLVDACTAIGARFVHVSTDCVFSGDGDDAPYVETRQPAPVEVYGRSKLAGEPSGAGCVVLRTSMIGHELRHHRGLLAWLLSQPEGATVRGFTRALFSGPTNLELARLILQLIDDAPTQDGLFHVGVEGIDKCSLLEQLVDAFALNVTVVPDDTVVVDRRLDASALREAIGWEPPSWATLIDELASEHQGA